jgi:hypothetical protein
MAFIKLRSNNEEIAIESGEAIVKVSKSVFSTARGSEWAKFVVDPHKWLFENNYRYVDGDGTEIGSGRIPASLELMPVPYSLQGDTQGYPESQGIL